MTTVLASFLTCALAAAAPKPAPARSETPTPTSFDRLYAAGEELERVPEAKNYLPKAYSVVGPALGAAMKACSGPDNVGFVFRVVIRISGLGKVSELRFEPQSALTACVAKHLVI